MTGITIDKLDIKEHIRYAQDQQLLDPVYLKESGLVHPHSEITGTSSIYASQWELLFETRLRNIPWALFSPPMRYHVQTRRFFGTHILPTIYWETKHQREDGEDKEKEEENQNPYLEKIQRGLDLAKQEEKLTDQEVKESNVLCNLFESIGLLNSLLAQVNAKKIQYQKG